MFVMLFKKNDNIHSVLLIIFSKQIFNLSICLIHAMHMGHIFIHKNLTIRIVLLLNICNVFLQGCLQKLQLVFLLWSVSSLLGW